MILSVIPFDKYDLWLWFVILLILLKIKNTKTEKKDQMRCAVYAYDAESKSE